MSNYRRILIPGGTYFFTVNLHDRRARLLTEYIDDFRTVYSDVKSKHPFKTRAICVLPDHLHCLWELPDGDSDYPMRWRLIKAGFTRALRRKGIPQKIWQNRYWEHHIRDDEDFGNHVNYIHANPVTHGYVENVEDWPYSSWHKYDKDEKAELRINREKWDLSKFGD